MSLVTTLYDNHDLTESDIHELSQWLKEKSKEK